MERRLTEAVIPALRTKKPQEEVYHTGTPSAGIRLTRDGAKTFFVRYRSPTVKKKGSAEPALRRFYFGLNDMEIATVLEALPKMADQKAAGRHTASRTSQSPR